MDFRWKSQTDNSRESPASSGSETEPFYSYSAEGAARSELEVYNALFGSNEAGSSSSVLGLTSMDFWNMDDVKPMAGTSSSGNPATYNSAAYARSQQDTFAPAQPAGASTYGDTYNALGKADTPDAVMVFDDLSTGATYKSVANDERLPSLLEYYVVDPFSHFSVVYNTLRTRPLRFSRQAKTVSGRCPQQRLVYQHQHCLEALQATLRLYMARRTQELEASLCKIF
jgi:hypothetical protein